MTREGENHKQHTTLISSLGQVNNISAIQHNGQHGRPVTQDPAWPKVAGHGHRLSAGVHSSSNIFIFQAQGHRYNRDSLGLIPKENVDTYNVWVELT